MSKPTILTAPRLSNELHIGNYLGALLPMVDLAKTKAGEYQLNLFVADLHGLTTPIDYAKVQPLIYQYVKMFVAAGFPIENPDVHIYRQSYIPAHSELAWILECFTGMGEMKRMTQYKEKSRAQAISDVKIQGIAGSAPVGMTPMEMFNKGAENIVNIQSQTEQEKNVSVGLFNYPVLMACDILLYGAEYVPVGDDQNQHIEFTRDIGHRMNERFGNLFTLPLEVKQQHEFFGKDQGLRIKDLADPGKKMSKSDETGKGVIFLNDVPDVAYKKIMSATTDDFASVDYDPEKQPGISNLLQIYGLLSGKSVEEASQQFAGQTQYGEFKKVVAQTAADFLKDFQTKLSHVDQAAIDKKLVESEAAMNIVANETLLRVQKAVGLRN